jgi:hypothetical protein
MIRWNCVRTVQVIDGSSGHQRRSAGDAKRAVDPALTGCLGEGCTCVRQSIDVGRLDQRIAQGMHGVVALVVGEQNQHMREGRGGIGKDHGCTVAALANAAARSGKQEESSACDEWRSRHADTSI